MSAEKLRGGRLPRNPGLDAIEVDAAPMPTSVTAELGRYLSSTAYVNLPALVRTQAVRVLQDTIGVMLGASTTSAMSLLYTRTAGRRTTAEATLIGRSARDTVEAAAFLNAVAGHTIELDDSHGPSMTHAASTLVSAGLSVAELDPSTTVGQLLTGIVAGYDVIARLSRAIGVQQQYDLGFFPSSVCGSVAAAACAGVVLGLDATQMERALALGASQSSGLLAYGDDPSHMAKSFQIGIAARNGVQAALVARSGFGGRVDVFGGRHSMLTPFGGNAAHAPQLLNKLGTEFDILQTSLKRFACCRQVHAAVDGLLDIVDREHLTATDIERIDVQLSASAVARVDNNPLWTHNVQYILALASREGTVLPDHFTDQWTGDPELTDLSRRVTVRSNAELQAAWPTAKGAIVTVTTVRGAHFERTVPRAVGDPNLPMPLAVLSQKFRTLAGWALSPTEVEKLLARFAALRPELSVREFAADLRAAARTVPAA